MSRLFVADTGLARTACSINCAHRGLAGLIAVAGSPQFPVPIARAGSLHTWPAFRDALEGFIAGTDWGRYDTGTTRGRARTCSAQSCPPGM